MLRKNILLSEFYPFFKNFFRFFLKFFCNFFRLNTSDGAEYLFSAETHIKMIEWVDRINFHAKLAPSNQLASFQTGV